MRVRFYLLPIALLGLAAACARSEEAAPASAPADRKSEKDGAKPAASTSPTPAADAPAEPEADEEGKPGSGRARGTARQEAAPSASGSAAGPKPSPLKRDKGEEQKEELSEREMPPNMLFEHYGVNPTVDTDEEPRSTFAIDVDTASYTMTRSFLERGTMPAEAAVRVEEVVNAFDYGYAAPTDGSAFNVFAEAAPSPNRNGYHVLHVGIQGKEVAKTARKAANLVFVVDVSGSMAQDNRLDLVKTSLRLLVGELGEADTVGLVSYGDAAVEVLAPTSAHHKDRILAAVDGLDTGGSTNAEAGVRLGYQMVARSLREGGINRVILCSDGVANVGVTGPQGLLEMVGAEVKRGITISTIGVGMGTYNDVLMEQLADKGNGNYHYVDKPQEAERVFVSQLTGTLQVIAKDVKIQVEFDKSAVSRYRLIGYENRGLSTEEFDDDEVDAGEVGAGHAVTAIYEIKLKPGATSLGNVRVRYQEPEGGSSKLVEKPIVRTVVKGAADSLSSPTRLSLVAAQFGEKLRGSYWARNLSYGDILGRLDGLGPELRQRADIVELRKLIVRAQELDKRGDKFEAKHGPIAQMDFDRVPVLR